MSLFSLLPLSITLTLSSIILFNVYDGANPGSVFKALCVSPARHY